jgi:hypothetical protein
MFEQELKQAIETGNLADVIKYAKSDTINKIYFSNVNDDDDQGTGATPLTFACTKWLSAANAIEKATFKEIIQHFLALGADIDLADKTGFIPRTIIGSKPEFITNIASTIQSSLHQSVSSTAYTLGQLGSDVSEPAVGGDIKRRRIATTTSEESPEKTAVQSTSAVGAASHTQSPDSEKGISDTSLSTDLEDSKVIANKSRELRFIIPRVLSKEGNFELGFHEVAIDTANRPDTYLKSEGQGDHTTAYIAVMEMLLSAIVGENIQDVPEILYELAKCFLAEDNYEALETVKNSFAESLREHVINRTERKQLTKAMRVIAKSDKRQELSTQLQQAFSVIEAQRAKVKNVIKEQEQVLLLEGVCQIGETIVKFHQNDSLAVLSKKRVEGAATRPGSEGNRVKTAMLYLKLLNHLIELKNKMPQGGSDADKKTQQELLEDYQEIFTDIIRATKPTIKLETKIDENFNDFLELVFNYQGPKITLFDSKSIWPNQIDLKNIQFDALGRLFNDLFDFRFVARDLAQIEDDRLKLPNIAAKHIVCLFMAFKQLNNFEPTIKQNVVLQFSHMIIEDVNHGGQGWKKCPSGSGTLDAPTLFQDIIKFIRFEKDCCKWIHEDSDQPILASTI